MSSSNKEKRLIDGYISRYALLYYVATRNTIHAYLCGPIYLNQKTCSLYK